MNHTEINLNVPFEKTLAAVLALPQGGDRCSSQDETVALALRCLYTAAHGHTLRTSIGPISIMAGVDSALKDAPFSLCTRTDLLALAERRTEFRRRATKNNDSAQGRAGSALSEYMAGRLGSPEWWPHDCRVKPTVIRVRRTKHATPLNQQRRGRPRTHRFTFRRWGVFQ
jgi:hypothetical protein